MIESKKIPPTPPVVTASRALFANLRDRLLRWVTLLFAICVVAIVLLMMVEMARNSTLSFRRFGFGFLFSSNSDPVRERFGPLPFIYGTVVPPLLALLLAVPLSL